MRALALLALLAAPLAALAPAGEAHKMVPWETRETVLPPPVANVSQSPWNPQRGDDIAVYVTLREGWRGAVMSMPLRYCRVEPSYVCWPQSVRMQPDGGSTARWVGVIEWDARFVEKDTRHVGYNLSVVYANGTEFEAPTRNFNAPSTFPLESGGVYFFYSVSGAKTLNAFNGTPFVIAATVAGGLLLAWWARRRRGGAPRGPS